MFKKHFLVQILFSFIIVITVASCDKDFNQLGTNIIGEDHFGFTRDITKSIKAVNQALGPIASNNLPINPLGFYTNSAFGTTKADFVTQVELSSINPTFNNTDPTLYVALPTMDSVVMNIPYFNKLLSTDGDGKKTYELDSIYGFNGSKFKLNIYQSNYYLRDLDPDQALGQQQLFYTDNTEIANNIVLSYGILNNDGNTNQNSQFFFDKNEHNLTNTDATVAAIRSAPSMRLRLDKNFFYNKIINAPSGKLADNATFKNYFRGLYFQPESLGNPGNMAMINFKGGTITLYYKEDKITPDNTATTTVNEYKVDRINKTYVLNLTGNSVSLLSNSNENADYLTAINNPVAVPEKLYLKGGQGSMAIIDIFGPDANNNGIADEIETIKADGWLINEANLTFYIDKTSMADEKTIEPNRIFLFDIKNKKVLADYLYDFSSSGLYPKFSKNVFGGILSNLDGTFVNQAKSTTDGSITKKGDMYKIRITNHVRNLILHDSTNVRLGLSVSETINNIGFSKLKTTNINASYAPTMSVQSPLGTILYGTSPLVPDDKRLKLEIWYTKPN